MQHRYAALQERLCIGVLSLSHSPTTMIIEFRKCLFSQPICVTFTKVLRTYNAYKTIGDRAVSGNACVEVSARTVAILTELSDSNG